MTEPLLLFSLEETLFNICKWTSDNLLVERKYYCSDVRYGANTLMLKCIKLGYHIGVYTLLKENDAINIINNRFNMSFEFKYILTQESCKRIDGKLYKCLDHVDIKRYRPILIDDITTLVDSNLLPYTIRIPSVNVDSRYDMDDLYSLLKQIYKSDDAETTIKLVKDWNEKRNDFCIIS